MCSSDKPSTAIEHEAASPKSGEEHQERRSVGTHLDLVTGNPTAIAAIDDPAPEVQLAAIAQRIDLYWQIRNPCEAATIEYLHRRPYDIQRFRDIPDEIKAKVIIRSPQLIHDWIKRGYIAMPVEPDGFHHAVIREFLFKLARNIPGRSIMSTITRMRSLGYDWPEFQVIEKSITADEKAAIERQDQDQRI